MQTNQEFDEHDIKSAISSLQSGLNLVTEEWKENPELVGRILPLMLEKIKEIQNELEIYQQRK